MNHALRLLASSSLALVFSPADARLGLAIANRPGVAGPVAATSEAPSRDLDTSGTEHVVACRSAEDNRPAIQAAIDATPRGGLLTIRANGHVCGLGQDGRNPWILQISKSIRIAGTGFGSALNPLPSVGPEIDLFDVAPHAGTTLSFSLEHLFLGDPNTGTRHGRHGVFIDTTAVEANVTLSKISDVFIARSASGGNAVNATNRPASNVNGGFYASTIEDSVLGGGIALNGSGDSLRILRNTLTGINAGVYVNLVSAGGGTAGNLLIEANNCTAAAGCIVVDQAFGLEIAFNELEQSVTNTEPNNALIDLRGATSAISAATVYGNQLQSAAKLGDPILLRIGRAIGTSYDANRMATGRDWVPVLNTTQAINTIVGRANSYVGSTTHMNDMGIATKYPVSAAFVGSSQGAILTPGITEYVTNGSPSRIEANVGWIVPFTGLFTNLQVTTGGSPGAIGSRQLYAATLRNNYGTTMLTCSILAGSNQCSDTVHSVMAQSGQIFDLQILSSDGAKATTFKWSIQLGGGQ